MSLADFEQALLALTRTALETAGRPVTMAYRYHGEVAVQDDCDMLTVHWNPVTVNRAGIPDGVWPPIGRRQADMIIRLYRCFPTVDGDGSFDTADADAASEGLAVDLEVVWNAVVTAICDRSLEAHLIGCNSLELIDASPRRPAGGRAGNEWRVRARWAPLG